MELWSVYDRAADDRSPCEVRKVLVKEDGLVPADTLRFRSIQEARSALARRGLIRVPRGQQDEPELVETWL